MRSILFTSDEIHSAVSHLLLQRIKGLQPSQIEHIIVQAHDGVVRATVRLAKQFGGAKVLDPHELMSAILIYCRRARIPLPSRSHKRLGVTAGCLSLTALLNPDAIEPWVDGDTVIHGRVSPILLPVPPR